MSEEALKQEEVIEEEGEVIDLEESKPEEPAIVETPTEDGAPEVVTEEPEPEKSEEELQDYSDLWDDRNFLTPEIDNYIPSPLPSPSDTILDHNISLQ